MERTLLSLVRELNSLNDDNLAERVVLNNDVQWCLGELQDILDVIGDMPVSRLRELAQADREGRCVVLPCKVRDTLYDIYEAMGNGTGEIRELKVTDIHIHLDKRSKEWLIVGGYYFSLSDFGKTVFLTRAEAEAALRRE